MDAASLLSTVASDARPVMACGGHAAAAACGRSATVPIQKFRFSEANQA